MDFALCIGIDKYLNLNETIYAENDARAFRDLLKSVFYVDNPILLLGSQATYKNIEINISKIAKKIDNNDRFLFFFAGHGENFNEIPHISCYDSDSYDIENSWHHFQNIIGKINSTGCNKSLYFLDACESTIRLGSRKHVRTTFSAEELENYFKSVTYTSVFSSCSHKGIADVNEDEKHGIWTFYLLKALKGDAPEAIDKSNRITNTLLQRYLKIKVEAYCKATPACTEIQKAFTWGKQEGEFVIIQFPAKKITLYKNIAPKPLQRVRFVTKTTCQVKSLSGFSKAKRHFIPELYNDAAIGFINTISEEEIKDHMNAVATSLRSLFKLKLKDYKLDIQDGYGEFTCPYLKYSFDISLKKSDTSVVVLTGELVPLEIDKIIEKANDFDGCFPNWFDFLLYQLAKKLDIRSLINHLEDLDEDKLNGYTFDYDTECTRIIMKHSDIDREIIFKTDYIKIIFKATEDIPSMLDSLKETANQLLLVNPAMKLLD